MSLNSPLFVFIYNMLFIYAIDLRRLFFQAGVENKPTVFIFNDTQVVEEIFLEDVNNVLSSGEVPNLYKPDEFEEVTKNVCHTTKVKRARAYIYIYIY